MISIITSIYNQLHMNRLFWSYLKKYTDNKFELIIIDNNSDDGSRAYFRSLAAAGESVVLIENEANYTYPYCQNQGIAVAKGDVMVFFNNDLLVSPHWDSRMMRVIGKNDFEVVSFASNDRMKSQEVTKVLSRRWKRIKYPIITLFGQSKFSLTLMAKLCYGNWERHCEKIYREHGLSMTKGFSGSAIAITRKGIEKIGEWDIHQYGADFDIFYRSCDRWERVGDMKPIATINGVFIHHYRRLTLYKPYPPFADAANIKRIEEKWAQKDIDRWINGTSSFPDIS